MGLLDSLKAKLSPAKDKVADLAQQHGEKIDHGLDKAARMVDEKTKGKYSGKIQSGTGKAKEALDRIGHKDDATPGTGTAPGQGATPGHAPGPGGTPENGAGYGTGAGATPGPGTAPGPGPGGTTGYDGTPGGGTPGTTGHGTGGTGTSGTTPPSV
ncbi:antitoxin [Streptomyces sp. NPDC058671]|uniref:antitoxin n=1 Tax=Streptomyces sp. NPDC058671 TaxID=3346590 RepID=UPI00366221BF